MTERVRPFACFSAAVVLLVLLSACGQGVRPAASPSGPRPQSTASLAIVEPTAARIITTSSMHVRLTLQGARIVPQTSTDLTPDEGHVHVTVDGHLLSMNYTLEDDVNLQGLNPGPHLLQAEFVAKDHAPFAPRVIAKVLFEYEPAGR